VVDLERWGIAAGYHDAAGEWRQPPRETIVALLEVMGAITDAPPAAAVRVTSPGRGPALLGVGQLVLEDGTAIDVRGEAPPDLPIGYHRFEPSDLGDGPAATRVIVSPGLCWFPEDLRVWGWAAQLYATRSTSSWGIGDLADLRRLGRWAARRGAGVSLINPLHAVLPSPEQEPSPYHASSRCFRNPLYLRIEELPGAGALPGLDDLAQAGRALNQARRIDRDAVWRLKSDALEALFARFHGDPAFDRYRDVEGPDLEGYATFCALGEHYGYSWRTWPESLRRPDRAGTAAFAATLEGGRRIRYHAWLQWLLDEQLRRAAVALPLIHDLAIGASAEGADAWRWQDSFAGGVRVGAPPDEFNALGQDWGLPPFDPWRLRAAGYEPFIRVVRAGLRHAAGLRFDHVMGLFRLFWIPEGRGATEGTYVRYPWEDLLDILALESVRAGAFIVGEDLGTVEDFTRAELFRRRVLSYRLLWFEADSPDSGRWPHQALAAVSTHDLPTVAGLWTGSDLEAQRAIGLHPNEGATINIAKKLAHWTGADPDADVETVIERTYELLGRSPAAVVTATLDDALGVQERPNLPGTIDEWPNWRLALPLPLEEIETAPLAEAIGVALDRRNRPGPDG